MAEPMAEPTFNEYIHAPRKQCWVKCYLPDPKHSDKILFKTVEKPLAMLSMGDIIAKDTAWETEDMIILYSIYRINKKTITVKDCDQFGAILNDGKTTKLKLYDGFTARIVDTKYPYTLK